MGRQRAGPEWPFPGRPQDTTRNPKAAPGREHGPQKAILGCPESLPCLLLGPGQAHGEGLPTGGEKSRGQKRLRLPFHGRLQPLRPFTCPAQQVDLTRGGCSQTMWRSLPPPSRPPSLPQPDLLLSPPHPPSSMPQARQGRGGTWPACSKGTREDRKPEPQPCTPWPGPALKGLEGSSRGTQSPSLPKACWHTLPLNCWLKVI